MLWLRALIATCCLSAEFKGSDLIGAGRSLRPKRALLVPEHALRRQPWLPLGWTHISGYMWL